MIIHSPIISGSMSFAEGASVTYPDGGVYSGSFSGSFQGDGSQLTGVEASTLNIDLFNVGTIEGDDELLFSDTSDSGNEKRGTLTSGLNSVGVISSSAQLYGDLDTRYGNSLGEGIVSSSTQISAYNTFLEINGDGVISGSSQIVFNDIPANPISQSASSATINKSLIPSVDNVLDLGSPTRQFRDLYLSSASLYIDGAQVLSSTTNELTITTDANQSLKLVETGTDTVQIQTENGDITFTSTGTGNIELDAPIQIGAGKKVLSSDGNAIVFGEDIDIEGNITLTGTVDGVDIAALGAKTLISGSSQISATSTSGFLSGVKGILNDETVISGSSQVVLESSDKTGFTGAGSITTLGTISTGVWQGSIIASQYLDADPLPAGTISGSSQVDHDATTNFVSNEHIDHTTVTMTAGNGLTGGGTIASTRTFAIGQGDGIQVNTNDIQVDGTVLRTGGFDIVSSSAQIDHDQTTNFVAGEHFLQSDITTVGTVTQGSVTAILPTGVVSGSSQVFSDISGDVVINSSGVATIQSNAVALGTDTTGNYVATLGSGTGVTIGSNTGEGSTPTIAVNYGSTANTAVQGNTTISISGTSGEIGVSGTTSQALGGAPSYTITLPDTITGDRTFSDNITVSGNLTVTGTTTTINSTNLNVTDKLIEVNRGGTTAASADGGGLFISGANESITWDNGNSRFNISDDVHIVGNITLTGTVDGRDVATDGTKLDGIDAGANNYTHPTHPGDDFSVDTGALTGATVVSDIDINVTTDTLGHVTDANGTVSTRTLTLADLGYTGDTDANKYVHPTHPGDDINLDTGVLSGATVISDLDFNITTDTSGHVTDANATYSTRNLTPGDLSLGTSDTVRFGKVGVGTAVDATYELKVSGDIGASGDIVAYISSDERLKDNIELISNPIEKVQSLRGVTWEWNDNASEAAKQSPNVGVIAQEVEKVLPQLVHDRENGFKGVDYAKLTGLLIEAIKDQQKQIDDLKSKIG